MSRLVRVRIECEYEIPDDWGVGHPFLPGAGGHLVIDGRYYMPTPHWLVFRPNEGGGGGWFPADHPTEKLLEAAEVELLDITITPVEAGRA